MLMAAAIDHKYFAVTGANAGLGAESVRQLLQNHNNNINHDGTAKAETRIYLLCRNVDSGNEIIETLSKECKSSGISLVCVQFDASNRSTVISAIELISTNIPDGYVLDGLLLNAGGFTSDTKGSLCESGATVIAETNLIGHAALVNGLIETKRIGRGISRVIFSGSEAGLGEPFAYKWANELDFYVNLLNGKRYEKNYKPADGYGHIKGMIAFYCAAIARRHTDIYFATVSPGSTRNTNLLDQGSFTNGLKFFIKGYIRMSGQHDVNVGAKRYIDALLPNQEGWNNYPSGTFVLSKHGYTGEVCNAIELKRGMVFGEESKEDYVYQAVQNFL